MQYAYVICLGDDLRPTAQLLLSSSRSREFITLRYRYNHENCGYVGLNQAVLAKKSYQSALSPLYILNSQKVRLLNQQGEEKKGSQSNKLKANSLSIA